MHNHFFAGWLLSRFISRSHAEGVLGDLLESSREDPLQFRRLFLRTLCSLGWSSVRAYLTGAVIGSLLGLRLATKGILGIVVFCCALTGYLTGVGMIFSALAKPFFPTAIGMWQPAPHSVTVGMVAANVQPMHEVLGWWYIPLALGIGVALILVTTLIVRACLWMSSLTDRLGPRLTLA